jgi:uncharacterized Zn finger protein
MRRPESTDHKDRYVVTEQGRYDLLCAPLCHCQPKLAGLLLTCDECGTVWGHVSESGRKFRPTVRRWP